MYIPILIVSIFLYFLPCLFAVGKRNSKAIFALNLFLGWTYLGWVAALIWALVAEYE